MNRRLDNLNRVTLPKEITNRLEINPGDDLDMKISEQGEIIIAKTKRNKNSDEIKERIEDIKAEEESDYNQGMRDALNWVLSK